MFEYKWKQLGTRIITNLEEGSFWWMGAEQTAYFMSGYKPMDSTACPNSFIHLMTKLKSKRIFLQSHKVATVRALELSSSNFPF